MGNARPLVAYTDLKELRRCLALEEEFSFSPAGVGDGIAGDLRHGGGNSRLILSLESQQFRNLSRSLADEDHVMFMLQGYGEDTHTSCP